jgi:hypothetical protein
MNFIKLEDEDRFVRDITNRSLINTDINSLTEYKSKKELSSKINLVSAEINTLKHDMSEIKSLIQLLVKQSVGK